MPVIDGVARHRLERLHSLDWARLLAVLLLIPFHAAAVFYTGELGAFYVVNPQSSAALNVLIQFLYQWHMPLLFFLAGAASWYSLQLRSSATYVWERLKRLLVPLLVGILFLVPPQVYIHELQAVGTRQTFLQFYPHFFDGIRPVGHFEWAHLWFLAYLLVISLLCLPVMLWLRHDHNKGCLATFKTWQVQLSSLLLLALPLMLSEALLRPRWPGFQNLYDDWANLTLYLLYFFYGYLFCHQPGFWVALDQHRWRVLGLAVPCMAILLWLGLSGSAPEREYPFAFFLFQALRGFNSWIAMLAVIALVRRFLSTPHSIVRYGNRAVLPLYLVHQPLLVVVAWFVVPLELGMTAKFFLICVSSLFLSLGVYEFVIRRLGLFRLCFGLAVSH
ncbi:MAG: acyltransferase family protein [Cyanobacteria bacterium]|nr:acyltransferase family protein [Cyanobacteria bacterium bin.51]